MMTHAMLHASPHRPPPTRDVLREQLRAVALVLRLPAIAAASLLAVGTTLVIGEFVTGGGGVDFVPELSLFPGMVGALLPIGVWRGEERFGNTLLWTLPVDRRHHVLAKVGAGWVWLMAAVGAFVLWYLMMALVTGGNIMAEQTITLLPADVDPFARVLDPAALRQARWTPQPLFWLIPFTAATGMYVLASAIALGSRHPLRWFVGLFLGALLFSAVGAVAGQEWAKLGPARLVETINDGRYGLDALLTGRMESLHTQATLTSGKTVGVWRALPKLGDWAIATLMWTALGVLALWGAASRHREERPG
jgi:hypothetical protein